MTNAERGGSCPNRSWLWVGWLLPAALTLLGCADPNPPAGAGVADTVGTHDARQMTLHYDPVCGCCSDWAAYMRQEGFVIDLRLSDNIAQTRRDLGVPVRLASCHMAEIGGYLVEGHVPADAVRQLLAEQPDALGSSAPGMPWGSPGMEISDRMNDGVRLAQRQDNLLKILRISASRGAIFGLRAAVLVPKSAFQGRF